MGLKDFFVKKAKAVAVEQINTFKEKELDGKDPIVIDSTMAAINIIRYRVERVIFYVSLATSVLFLAFYGYMIGLNAVENKITHTIVYAIMAFILISSSVLDFLLYPGKTIKMDFLAKSRFKFLKKIKRNVLIIVKSLVKAFSLGYALFEILTIEASTNRIVTLVLSFTAFIIQLIIYFITDLIMRYSNILMIGFNQDMENSGAFNLINKDNRTMIKANRILRTEKDKKIIEEINEQIRIDKANREKDKQIKKEIVDRFEEQQKALPEDTK